MRGVLEALTSFLGVLILALAVLAVCGDWADANEPYGLQPNCDVSCNAPGSPNCVINAQGRCPTDHATVCRTSRTGCSACQCLVRHDGTGCECRE